MLRALWGYRHVGAAADTIHLGRLALAGYSAGGGPLRQALAANRGLDALQEVWAFDTEALFMDAPLVKTWLDGKKGRVLRATYGKVKNGTYLEALRRRTETSSPGSVVVAPSSDAFWSFKPSALPQDSWWGACLQELHSIDAGRAQAESFGKGTCRHAFAMFGGQARLPSSGGRTFFEDFLRGSTLHIPA